MLGQLEASGSEVVIADMEAGVGILTRMPERSLDLLLLVTEPSAKSMEVSRRAAVIAAERNVGPVLVVANRVRTEQDVELVRSGTSAVTLHVVPEDDEVTRAERDGRSVLDVAPGARAVRSTAELSLRLRAALRTA